MRCHHRTSLQSLRVTRLSWRLVLRCFTIMTPLLLWTAEGLRAKASLHHSWVANCCSTDSQSSIPEARDKLETAWFTSLTIKVISKPGTSSLYPITALILEATASRCSLWACHFVLYLWSWVSTPSSMFASSDLIVDDSRAEARLISRFVATLIYNIYSSVRTPQGSHPRQD